MQHKGLGGSCGSQHEHTNPVYAPDRTYRTNPRGNSARKCPSRRERSESALIPAEPYCTGGLPSEIALRDAQTARFNAQTELDRANLGMRRDLIGSLIGTSETQPEQPNQSTPATAPVRAQQTNTAVAPHLIPLLLARTLKLQANTCSPSRIGRPAKPVLKHLRPRQSPGAVEV
jgi:hypothetical protein